MNDKDNKLYGTTFYFNEANEYADVNYWIDLAEYDLGTAKAMLNTERYSFVGFMCHRAIEEGLKALIAASGSLPPKSHSLIELIKAAKIYLILSQDQRDFLIDLNQYKNPSDKESYPIYGCSEDDINKLNWSLTESRCKTILSNTEELYKWIKSKAIEISKIPSGFREHVIENWN